MRKMAFVGSDRESTTDAAGLTDYGIQGRERRCCGGDRRGFRTHTGQDGLERPSRPGGSHPGRRRLQFLELALELTIGMLSKEISQRHCPITSGANVEPGVQRREDGCGISTAHRSPERGEAPRLTRGAALPPFVQP